MRAVHLILGFKPLSNIFQDASNSIRAGDCHLALIDITVPGFFARKDVVPTESPSHHVPPEAAAPREDTASSLKSLWKEIDQLHLEEEEEEQREPVISISDSEEDLDKSSSIHTSRLIVEWVDDSSKKE